MTARSTRWEIALVALLLVVLMRAVSAGPAPRRHIGDRTHGLILSQEAAR